VPYDFSFLFLNLGQTAAGKGIKPQFPRTPSSSRL
jgi:hypothetical protein